MSSFVLKNNTKMSRYVKNMLNLYTIFNILLKIGKVFIYSKQTRLSKNDTYNKLPITQQPNTIFKSFFTLWKSLCVSV